MTTIEQNIKAIKKMILDSRRITIRKVANDVCISLGLCQIIFVDVLGMKHATAKVLLKFLNFEQNQYRMDIAQELTLATIQIC